MRTSFLAVLLLAVTPLLSQSITSLSPATATAGGAGFTMHVNGSGFTSGNTVQWDGTSLTTTFVTSSSLSATVPAPNLATNGTHNVRVRITAFPPAFTNTVVFTVNNPVPTLNGITPSTTPLGSGPVTVTFSGLNFTTNSIARLGGTNLATTFISSTLMEGVLPASMTTTATNLLAEVFNPAPGGGTGTGGLFSVLNPVPALTSLVPSSVNTGASAFTLIANGGSFNSSSVIRFDGAAQTTSFVSANQVTCSVTPSMIPVGGTHAITVSNPGPGGGTDSGQTLTVNNQVPVFGGVSPTTVTLGVTSTLTVTGAFLNASTSVLAGGVALPTTFVTSSQVTAQITPASTGNVLIQLSNPAPGGGISTGSNSVHVENPVPVMGSITPTSALAGSGPLALTVNGSNFVSTSGIRFDNFPMTTTFVNSTQLTCTIGSNFTASAGNHTITVLSPTPGGGTSSGAPLAINNPVPSLASVSPGSALVGASALAVTLTGGSFLSSSVVNVDGGPITTAFVDAATLTATIPALALTAPGSRVITVSNPGPGGGTSGPFNFPVNHPVPAITSFSPTSAPVGSPSVTISVFGSGFDAASVVKIGTQNLTTSFVNSGQLDAVLPGGSMTIASQRQISVANPAPGGGTATSGLFLVANLVPVLTSISPSSMTLGDPTPVMVTVTGSQFASTSVAVFNGQSINTLFLGPTTLQAVISSGFVTTPGNRTFEIFTGLPGGGTSATLTFAVNTPVPTMTTLAPGFAVVGDPDTTATITGFDFLSGCSVEAVGSGLLATSFVSSTQITALIPAAILATSGNVTLRVLNPSPTAGPSSGLTLQRFNAVPTLASAIAVNAPLVVTDLESLSLTGTGFHPHSIVRLDGADMPTTFGGAVLAGNSLVANVAPGSVAAGTHLVTVFNPGNGGGLSGSVSVVFENPAPFLTGLSAVNIAGGGADLPISITGFQFMPSSSIAAGGLPLPTTFVSSTQLDTTIPAPLRRELRVWTISVTNAGPGGGSSSGSLSVDGPMIANVIPSPIPVLSAGSSPITIQVSGGPYFAGDQIRINGAAQATTLVNAGALSCNVDGSNQVFLHAGGVAVTVTRQGTVSLVASNAFGATIGNGVIPDNAGCVTLAPAPPAPFAPFDLRVEIPEAGTLVTLIADLATPPTSILSLVPGFDLAVGPGLGSPIALVDGIGIFGPPTGTTTVAEDLSGFGVPNPRSIFELLSVAVPPLGVTFSLAAVYASPSSPIGLNVTHVSGPYSL